MGRPTKYRKNFPDLAQKYFDIESVAGHYPGIAGLAVFLDCCKSEIYEWAKIHKDFSDALEKGSHIAEKILMNKALDQTWNPGFSKFLAINNFGMLSDNQKLESNNTHNFPAGITISFIDKKET